MPLLQSVTLAKLKKVAGPSTMLDFFGIELDMIDLVISLAFPL